ncbi:hypothetical protein K443DRAFT_262424 [Laccaria amethystina LaAM-08-1]|uniref:Uncharacterized protein n=1 Tax=Laccaria amethystina LaAM-08-1 TaxID=1095629 RepID=A0A0C9Y8K3_9AGAR|nr:hypothetical protein K443DRAFT_262424 [Laccaria amethystina LaAM-08-1]
MTTVLSRLVLQLKRHNLKPLRTCLEPLYSGLSFQAANVLKLFKLDSATCHSSSLAGSKHDIKLTPCSRRASHHMMLPYATFPATPISTVHLTPSTSTPRASTVIRCCKSRFK